MMIYLVQSERSSRLRVENPSGISEEQSFRFQPVLHSNEIVISLGQDHAADSERGDRNQRSLHIVESRVATSAQTPEIVVSAFLFCCLRGSFEWPFVRERPCARYRTERVFFDHI